MTKWRKRNKKAELSRRGEQQSFNREVQSWMIGGGRVGIHQSVCHSLYCAEAEFGKLQVRAEIV